MAKQLSSSKTTTLATAILAAVFGLVVFHAPISVFFGQYAPSLLVKSWKEIVLLATIPLIFVTVWRAHMFKKFAKNNLLRLIVAYALLHLFVWVAFPGGLNQKFAGLAIDLRYFLFFALIFCVVCLQPSARKVFLRVGMWAAGFAIGFAALQALVLPRDILKYLGYSKHTIAPFLTVDSNKDFIRINGTLRGPNPLGAYAVTILALGAAWVTRSRAVFLTHKVVIVLSTLGLLVVLWTSYSRSAAVAAVISLAIIFFVRFSSQLRLLHWLSIGILSFLIIVVMFGARNTYFVQNIIGHSNPSHSGSLNSNQGHAMSVEAGVARLAQQPLGAGIGSTGSASLLGQQPLIIENQYLFIAHEVGWLGLAGFVAIFAIILRNLYQNRRDWLSLGVFASGIGLAVIGLIQPVFVDDTVSLVWWGLAAVALAAPIIKRTKRA
jgi:hypothetical protein